MRHFRYAVLCGVGAFLLSGCAAIAIVDTTVGVATTVVDTTVDVAAGAVRAVAGSSKKDEEKVDCADEKNKDNDVCKKPKSE